MAQPFEDAGSMFDLNLLLTNLFSQRNLSGIIPHLLGYHPCIPSPSRVLSLYIKDELLPITCLYVVS